MGHNRNRSRRRPAPRHSVTGTHVRLPGGVDVKLTSPPPAPFSESGRVRGEVAVSSEAAAGFLQWVYRQDPRYTAYILTTIFDHVAATARLDEVAGLEGTGWSAAEIMPDSPTDMIMRRLDELRDGDGLALCVHVRQQAPAAAVWQAYRPGKLRCWDCAHDVDLEIRGTAEDRRCDHCGFIGHGVFSGGAVVAPRAYRGVIVPVGALFGLCRRCRDASRRPPMTGGPAGDATR